MAMDRAEKALKLTPEGNGSYSLDLDSLRPKKPQSPAQHQSVKKAALASAIKRKGFQ